MTAAPKATSKDSVKLSPKNQASVDRMEAFMQRAALAQAPAWMPEEGDSFRGKIVGFRMGKAADYPEYPIIIYRLTGESGEFDGDYLAFHAFHEMVKERMAELKAKVDDIHTVLYGGKVVTNATRDKDPADQTQYHLYYIESDTEDKSSSVMTEMNFG